MARSKCIEFQNGKQEDSGYGILASFFHTFLGFKNTLLYDSEFTSHFQSTSNQ